MTTPDPKEDVTKIDAEEQHRRARISNIQHHLALVIQATANVHKILNKTPAHMAWPPFAKPETRH